MLSGAVARVGIPSCVSDVEMVFNGIDAKFKAPPTNPCTPLKGPVITVAAAGAGAVLVAVVVVDAAAAPKPMGPGFSIASLLMIYFR